MHPFAPFLCIVPLHRCTVILLRRSACALFYSVLALYHSRFAPLSVRPAYRPPPVDEQLSLINIDGFSLPPAWVRRRFENARNTASTENYTENY